MADDGITTAGEMLELLMEAMELCTNRLKTAIKPTNEYGDVLDRYCPGEWDNLICWPDSPPGAVRIQCPDYILDFNHDGFATRHCSKTGEWVFSNEANKTWVDYSDCYKFLPPEVDLKKKITEGTPRIKSMIQLYTVGYSFSLVALTFAMIILAYFQRLHCTRNYIHMHLFASFMLRAIVIFVKDRVLFIGAGIFDVQTQSEASLPDLLNGSTSGGSSYKVGCKLVMTLFHYFVATNYYWILVEALYLHSLIFVAFFSDKKYLWRFTLTGWGVPVLFVVPWAIVRGTLEDIHCWDIAITEYKWIYNGPIVVANVINFLLFLNIIRVLWYKMRERGAINRTNNRQQYRKLAKSTLVLIPMFGVHAIVFIGMPDNVENGIWWDIRMYFDLFFNSFQGFFVAIIYCFCNGEVQAEFRKAWERFNLSVEMQRGNRERSRSSVTMLSSFNSSMSQQARLSIAGQGGNMRNTNFNKNLISNNNTTSFHVNGQTTQENRTPLLAVKDEISNNNDGNGTCIEMKSGDFLLNLGEDEHLAPCTNTVDCSLQKSDAIGAIPIVWSATGEDFEEKEFEKALDGAADSEKLQTIAKSGNSKSSSVAGSDGIECAASSTEASPRTSSCDADAETPRSKRIPSCDSGISSMLGGATSLLNPTPPPGLAALTDENDTFETSGTSDKTTHPLAAAKTDSDDAVPPTGE